MAVPPIRRGGGEEKRAFCQLDNLGKEIALFRSLTEPAGRIEEKKRGRKRECMPSGSTNHAKKGGGEGRNGVPRFICN